MNGADDEISILTPHLDRVARIALLVGGLGLVASVVTLMTSPKHAFASYLMAFLPWLGLSMGCVALAMLYHVVGGRWGAIRPTLETGARGVFLMALLFVPILFGLHQIYPWANPVTREQNEVVSHQAQIWQSPGFFTARAIGYFVVWIVMALVLNRRPRPQPGGLSAAQTGGDGNRGADQPTRRHNPSGSDAPSGSGSWLKTFSAPGLIVYAVTISLAAIDWAMSLQPGWYSSIFGLLFIAGQGLSALAFSTAVLMVLTEWLGRARAHHAELGRSEGSTISAGEAGKAPFVLPSDFNDLGNLMLTFTMLWAYMSFSQFLIIWAGNLPDETQYYKPRMQGGWQFIGLALIVLHWALPFFCLLSRDLKRKARNVGLLAVFILVMRQVDFFWVVSPSVHRGKTLWHSLDFADFFAPIAVGGLWIAFFAWNLAARARGGLSLLPPPAPDEHGGHGAHDEVHAHSVAVPAAAVAQGGGHHG